MLLLARLSSSRIPQLVLTPLRSSQVSQSVLVRNLGSVATTTASSDSYITTEQRVARSPDSKFVPWTYGRVWARDPHASMGEVLLHGTSEKGFWILFGALGFWLVIFITVVIHGFAKPEIEINRFNPVHPLHWSRVKGTLDKNQKLSDYLGFTHYIRDEELVKVMDDITDVEREIGLIPQKKK